MPPTRPSFSTSEKPMMALSGVRSSCDMFARNSDFMRLASSSSTFFCCSACSTRLSSVTSRADAKTPCRLRSRSWNVEALNETIGARTVAGARRQLVVGDRALVEHALDARLGAIGIGEVVLERRADQLVARAAGQRRHLAVDVGDDAARVGRHQRIDVRLDQRAGVEVLIAQALVELHPLFFDLLIGTDNTARQQVGKQRGNLISGSATSTSTPVR